MEPGKLQRRSAPALALVDNHDSFTFNVWQLLRQLGAAVEVFSNDDRRVFAALGNVRGVVLSPGHSDPSSAGLSTEVLSRAPERLAVMGICLGHQVLGAYYGAAIRRAQSPLHGEAESVFHNGDGLFEGVTSPFLAARYNSLSVDESTLDPDVLVTARATNGEVMALRHRRRPHFGIQFHPESILSEYGHVLLNNWLSMLEEPA